MKLLSVALFLILLTTNSSFAGTGKMRSEVGANSDIDCAANFDSKEKDADIAQLEQIASTVDSVGETDSTTNEETKSI